MIQQLFYQYIITGLAPLGGEVNFFALSTDARKQYLREQQVPAPLIAALASMEEKDLEQELVHVHSYLTGGQVSGLFLASFGLFCTRLLGDCYDTGNVEGYHPSFAAALADLPTWYSYQELSVAVQAFLEACSDRTPYVMVQSPLGLTIEQRQMVRKEFAKNYTLCFPHFSTSPALIGGLRIFEDGQVTDYSWSARLQQLYTVLHSRV